MNQNQKSAMLFFPFAMPQQQRPVPPARPIPAARPIQRATAVVPIQPPPHPPLQKPNGEALPEPELKISWEVRHDIPKTEKEDYKVPEMFDESDYPFGDDDELAEPSVEVDEKATDTESTEDLPEEAPEKEPEPTAETPVQLTDDEKQKAHDEAEAKRKAEWEARQKAKKEAEEKALAELVNMTDDEIGSHSSLKVGSDAERLTRRNMKICVTEHIQEKCMSNPGFARLVMHPRKNMINCFKYINRQAQEFLKQEMEDNGEKAFGMMGGDVPDDLCYKWAEDYFADKDAKEDEESDEKFIPKTYYGAKSKAKPKAKEPAKKPAKEKSKKEEATDEQQAQLTLEGVA
jgi:hypothetical protein